MPIIRGDDVARWLVMAQSISPAVYTSTTTGAEVNCKAYASVAIAVDVGDITAADAANYMTFKIQQAVPSGAFEDPDTAQYCDPDNGGIGDWDRKLNATTEKNNIYRFNFLLKPGYPRLKVVAEETGTFSGLFGSFVYYYGDRQPAA